jgi:4-hydroxybenzoate polyprenyltransferase
MYWLQLVRWKNLLIIFFAQLLAWWCIVLPESPEVLDFTSFLFIGISTVLIAAAGYIINDYFDIRIDAINRPGRVILEKVIPLRQAIISHAVLSIIGLALAGYVATRAHHYEWLWVQVCCILLLWFYSTDFKRKYLSGNIVVSLLTALTMLTLFIYEPVMKREMQLPAITGRSSLPVWVLLIYAYFAFILTWMREIVKDMEDYKGDEAGGCMTMPIKKGLEYSTRFAIVLSALAVIPLLLASVILSVHHFFLLPAYLFLCLILPLAYWSFFIGKGFTARHYGKASSGLKLIMLSGICSLIIYHIQLVINGAA